MNIGLLLHWKDSACKYAAAGRIPLLWVFINMNLGQVKPSKTDWSKAKGGCKMLGSSSKQRQKAHDSQKQKKLDSIKASK